MSPRSSRKRFRICFAGSGGGHLRQLLQLLPEFSDQDYSIITEKTCLSLSISGEHPTRFVEYFHFGQKELDGWRTFIFSGIKNLLGTIWHFSQVRADVVISTGSGSVLGLVILSWVFRRKFIYIESIARVDQVSLFGRMVMRYADLVLVQWPPLDGAFGKAKYCDPLSVESYHAVDKRPLTMVTVGTGMPFDRMVGAVNDLVKIGKLEKPVKAQVGGTNKHFDCIEYFAGCTHQELIEILEQSQLVICHAGTGSILEALNAGCKVVAMARRADLGEHYDDHQLQIASALEERGLIAVAKDENDVGRAIEQARQFPDRKVTYDPDSLAKEIKRFLGLL